jgi:pimeloyl-ACP methyl ester carboxylesterase
MQVPTMIVWGERDGFVAVEHGKAKHEGIPQAEFVTIPNAGHLPQIEALEACANVISNVLRKSGA